MKTQVSLQVTLEDGVVIEASSDNMDFLKEHWLVISDAIEGTEQVSLPDPDAAIQDDEVK